MADSNYSTIIAKNLYVYEDPRSNVQIKSINLLFNLPLSPYNSKGKLPKFFDTFK